MNLEFFHVNFFLIFMFKKYIYFWAFSESKEIHFCSISQIQIFRTFSIWKYSYQYSWIRVQSKKLSHLTSNSNFSGVIEFISFKIQIGKVNDSEVWRIIGISQKQMPNNYYTEEIFTCFNLPEKYKYLFWIQMNI